jgi:RNA polymerase sigma-70 factor (ECF subfamily)
MTSEEFKIQMMPLKDKLFRFAERIVADREDAEDVIQDAFLKLWLKKDDLSQVKNLEAFSMVTVRNLCLDRLKSAQKLNQKVNNERLISQSVDGGELLEQKDDVNRIRKIIGELPETQRSVIHLRDIEELEFEEIAKIMKMSLNSVRVNLSRARKSVRSTLVKFHQYEQRGV